jgi:hypothetical protein
LVLTTRAYAPATSYSNIDLADPVTVTSTIIFRIIALVEAPFTALPKSSYLARGIDILQISNIGFSLISNLSATAVVGATAWFAFSKFLLTPH